MHININHANFKSKNENLFKKKLNKKIIYNIIIKNYKFVKNNKKLSLNNNI